MKNNNLVQGPILKNLIILASPLIFINLLNMAYNFTDMYFVGKISTEALSALGTASLFMWLSASIGMLTSIGIQVLISQAVGEGNQHKIQDIARNGIKLAIIISVSYGIITLIFAQPIIGLFNIGDELTTSYAVSYLRFVSLGLIFNTLNASLTSIFNALGDTKTVSKILVIGITMNIILDPIFIFVFDLGITGAAIATSLTIIINSCLLIYKLRTSTDLLNNFSQKVNYHIVNRIIKLSLPSAIQNIAYTIVAMLISIEILKYGVDAIAAQKIGSNVESFSWMISIGINVAMGVFIGQNYGAKQYPRIVSGLYKMLLAMSLYGLLLMFIMLEFPGQIMGIFTTDQNVIDIGIVYLQVLALAQIFVIFEGVGTGFFNGLGKTLIPAFFSLSGNIARIILVVLFSHLIGLNGIWIAMCVSGIYKGLGILICVFYYIFTKKYINEWND